MNSADQQERRQNGTRSGSGDLDVKEVLDFLRRKGLYATEQALLHETSGGSAPASASAEQSPAPSSRSDDAETKNGRPASLHSHHKDGEGSHSSDRIHLENCLTEYQNFVDAIEKCSSERCKPELSTLLFPVFAYIYLELVKTHQTNLAATFMERFGSLQEYYWQEYVEQLNRLRYPELFVSSSLAEALNKNSFVVRLSRDSNSVLRVMFTEQTLIPHVVKTKITLELCDSPTRSKDAVECMSGGMLGEAPVSSNKTKIYFGVFREQLLFINDDDDASATTATATIEDVQELSESKEKKKKFKSKDSILSKKVKSDPNAPQWNRIPLPEMTDAWKQERQIALREMCKRLKISHERLPSVCFYTLLNTQGGVCCAEITDDSSLLSAGFRDSSLHVFSLCPEALKPLKSVAELEKIDRDSDEACVNIFDESNSRQNIQLIGHSGPVYGVSCSPDRRFLLSCSEDCTVRLWSLHTWTNLVVYRLGGFVHWDVKFGPYGYYFVTGGSDRSALVWVVDRHQPIRMCVGHFDDVNCVMFHPNSNYFATGSDDRTVRVWDVLSGRCVRYFTGHKGSVGSLAFSSDGRILASTGIDGHVLLWDVNHGRMLCDLQSHEGSIPACAFSRDNNVLASGGIDNRLVLHSLLPIQNDLRTDTEPHTPPNQIAAGGMKLKDFMTKSTPICHLHFTRRNLLIGVGSFNQ